MREGRASATAQRVAAHRLCFSRPPAPFGDPAADERLSRDVADAVEIDPTARMARYLRARTEFVDRAVLAAITAGFAQIAVIGAGYDARALRYAAPGVSWFELDHPDTQRDKRTRLTRLGIDAGGVVFVPLDLTTGDVPAALAAAGHACDRPGLLICEGVLVYLEPDVAVAVLSQLRAPAAPDTRLVVTGGVPGSDPARRAAFAADVARVGEPAALGGADVTDLLVATGWRVETGSAASRRLGFWTASPA